jgi:hypothetical protein
LENDTNLQLNFGLCNILLTSIAAGDLLCFGELISDGLMEAEYNYLICPSRMTYLNAETFQRESLYL